MMGPRSPAEHFYELRNSVAQTAVAEGFDSRH